jgi:hypothetical protein
MFVDGGVELISPVKNCVLRWVGWRGFLATPHQKRACIKRKEKKNSQSYTWSPIIEMGGNSTKKVLWFFRVVRVSIDFYVAKKTNREIILRSLV